MKTITSNPHDTKGVSFIIARDEEMKISPLPDLINIEENKPVSEVKE